MFLIATKESFCFLDKLEHTSSQSEIKIHRTRKNFKLQSFCLLNEISKNYTMNYFHNLKF